MENGKSAQDIQSTNLLAQQVEAYRDDLISGYLAVLQEKLFFNRAEVRPNMLKQIATLEAETLVCFLNQPGFSPTEHGSQLYGTGLGERAVLSLGHVTRQFFLTHLETDQVSAMLETVHLYQEAVIQGFVQAIEKHHLGEIERTRKALQRMES